MHGADGTLSRPWLRSDALGSALRPRLLEHFMRRERQSHGWNNMFERDG
jgi:hypothetical protein